MSEESHSFIDIDAIQEMGINVADIKKLKDGGIQTVNAVMMCPKKELLQMKGLSEAKVSKIQEAGMWILEIALNE